MLRFKLRNFYCLSIWPQLMCYFFYNIKLVKTWIKDASIITEVQYCVYLNLAFFKKKELRN